MKNENKSKSEKENSKEDDLKFHIVEEESKVNSKNNKIKRNRTYEINEEIIKKLRKTDVDHDLIQSKCIFSDCDKSEDIILSGDKLAAFFEGGTGYHYICHTLPEDIDSWIITYSIKCSIDNIAIGYGILPIFQKSPFSSPELCMYLLNNGEAYEKGEIVYENGIIPKNLIYPLKLKVTYNKEFKKLKYSFGGYMNIFSFSEVPNEFTPCFVIWSNKKQEIKIESISY